MTKEFKKITNKSETRYVLESMTAGATGSASIAAAPGALGKLQKRLQELKDKVPQKPRQGPMRPQTGAGVHKNKKKDQQRGLEKHKGQSVYQEEFNGEYDDEAGMAESNLHTLARAVKGLMDTIDSNDNLPEWCQEKIAKAEMMLVSVWDYLLSQKEQGIDPEQGVAEGADVEYIVVIRDEQGKRSIRVSALTPTDAKEKAEAQGYKVLKVKDPNESHYFREQGVAEEHNDTFDPKSHQYKTTMKHADKPTIQQRMAAHDIKPGVAGYRDRIDMIRDLERTGKLKKDEGVDQSPESEILQSRIGSVLINLYDKGYTEEKIRMMQARIAKHLGYDPIDKQFQSAFNAVLTSPDQNMAEGQHPELNTAIERELVKTFKNNWHGGSVSVDQAIEDTIESLWRGHYLNSSQRDAAEEFLYYVADMEQQPEEPHRDHEEDRMGLLGVAEGGKKKGADGKACWKGYRYAGTKNGKDSCVKVGEDTYTEHLLSQLQEKFASQQQAKLMYAVAGDRDVAKKTGVSTATAREYIKKSHGQQVKDLPKKVKKK